MQKVLGGKIGPDLINEINSYLEKGWKVVNMVSEGVSISGGFREVRGRIMLVIEKENSPKE